MSTQQDKNDTLVLAIYPDAGLAQESIDGLKAWDHVNDEIKLGAIGTISKEDGKVKTHLPRKVGKGAKLGALVGIVAGVLTGGVTLLGGLVGGSAVGAITGAFFKQSSHLSKEEVEQIGQALDAGHVAVLVMCDDFEVKEVSQYLTAPGVKISTYSVPTEALNETTTAMRNLGELPTD